MNRWLLIIACLLVPSLSQAQEGTESSKDSKTQSVLSFEQAIEQAKLSTRELAASATLILKGKVLRFPAEAYFITADGILLSVITKNDCQLESIMIYDRRLPGAKLIGRDPRTGITLFSTDVKSQRPLGLATKPDLTREGALKGLRSTDGESQEQTYGLTRLESIGKQVINDVVLENALGGTSRRAQGPGQGPAPFFDSDGNDRLITSAVAWLHDGVIQALSYQREQAPLVWLPADEVRRVCNRLLSEAKLSPLPNLEPLPELSPPVETQDGRGEKVELQVDYRDSGRQIINGVVLDDTGYMATVYSPGLEKARCRQMGLVLDLADQRQLNEDVTVFQLPARVKYQPIRMGLDAAQIKVGDPLFDTVSEPGASGMKPCAQLSRLNVNLETIDGRWERLMTVDAAIRPGTPLFNQSGEFIGLCMQTPALFANTTFVITADEVWKLAGPALNEIGAQQVNSRVASLAKNGTSLSGLQLVITHRFQTHLSGAKGLDSDFTWWQDPIDPQLLQRIYDRLKKAFPELQFALQKEDSNLVVVKDAPHNQQLLASVDYWIRRLRQEASETASPNDKAAAQSEEVVDLSAPQTASPHAHVLLIPRPQKGADIKVIEGTFLNKSGDLVTWLPSEWVPGSETSFQRVEIKAGETPIPAQIVGRDEETGITVLSARIRCSQPFAWDAEEQFNQNVKFGIASTFGGYSAGLSINKVAPVDLRGKQYRDLGFLNVPSSSTSWSGTVVTHVDKDVTRAAGLALDVDPSNQSWCVLQGARVASICARLLATGHRPPLFEPPSQEALEAMRNWPLPAGAAWADDQLTNGDHVFNVAICFDGEGHFMRPGVYASASQPTLYFQGKPLKAFQVGADPEWDLTVWGVSHPIPEQFLKMPVGETKVSANEQLRLNPTGAAVETTEVPIDVTSVEKEGRGNSWKSRTIIRLNCDLPLGTPLFRGKELVAVIVRSPDSSSPGCVAYPASDIAAAIKRVQRLLESKLPKKDPVAQDQPAELEIPPSVPAVTPRVEQDVSVAKMIERIRSAKPGQRETLRKELLQLTAKQFDARHEKRLKELKALEARLASLRKDLQKRESLREDIIRKRVDDLLGADELEWDGDPVDPNGSRAVQPNANRE